MQDAINEAPKLHLVHGRKSPPGIQPMGCEALLSMLNRRVQALIDHVSMLEDRIGDVETAATAGAESEAASIQTISAGPVMIDHPARRVFVNRREIPLSPTEYRLMFQLASNSGKVVLHRDLLRRASIHGDVNRSNLKVYIGRLRAKLRSAGDTRCELNAVRGVGYRLTA